MKTVLIIAAGISQYPTIMMAKKKGWESVVVDGNPNALYKDLGDHFEVADIRSGEEVFEAVKKYKFDGVVVPGTDFPETAAYISNKLGLPGISMEVAKACSDKFAMRSALEKADILTPKFFYLPLEADSRYIRQHFKDQKMDFPLVIKPINNMAARGVRKIDSMAELFCYRIEAFEHSRTGEALLEEYKEGPELVVDAFVYDGKVNIYGIADRHYNLLPYFVERGHTMPSILDDEILDEVKKNFKDVVKAVGIDFGAAKGDVKVTEDGIMMVEIAARTSGGFMSGWTIPYAYGIYPHDALLELTVGNPLIDLTPKRHDWSAERCLISIPGKIREIIGLKEAKKFANPVHLHIKEGSEVEFPINSASRCGSAITHENTREKAISNALRANKEIVLRLEPNNEKTNKFLLSDDFRMFISGYRESDWHGVETQEALLKIVETTGVKLKAMIGKTDFWKCFYKGGIQGGIYYIDSFLN